jgi:hypothetical protein
MMKTCEMCKHFALDWVSAAGGCREGGWLWVPCRFGPPDWLLSALPLAETLRPTSYP